MSQTNPLTRANVPRAVLASDLPLAARVASIEFNESMSDATKFVYTCILPLSLPETALAARELARSELDSAEAFVESADAWRTAILKTREILVTALHLKQNATAVKLTLLKLLRHALWESIEAEGSIAAYVDAPLVGMCVDLLDTSSDAAAPSSQEEAEVGAAAGAGVTPKPGLGVRSARSSVELLQSTLLGGGSATPAPGPVTTAVTKQARIDNQAWTAAGTDKYKPVENATLKLAVLHQLQVRLYTPSAAVIGAIHLTITTPQIVHRVYSILATVWSRRAGCADAVFAHPELLHSMALAARRFCFHSGLVRDHRLLFVPAHDAKSNVGVSLALMVSSCVATRACQTFVLVLVSYLQLATAWEEARDRGIRTPPETVPHVAYVALWLLSASLRVYGTASGAPPNKQDARAVVEAVEALMTGISLLSIDEYFDQDPLETALSALDTSITRLSSKTAADKQLSAQVSPRLPNVGSQLHINGTMSIAGNSGTASAAATPLKSGTPTPTPPRSRRSSNAAATNANLGLGQQAVLSAASSRLAINVPGAQENGLASAPAAAKSTVPPSPVLPALGNSSHALGSVVAAPDTDPVLFDVTAILLQTITAVISTRKDVSERQRAECVEKAISLLDLLLGVCDRSGKVAFYAMRHAALPRLIRGLRMAARDSVPAEIVSCLHGLWYVANCAVPLLQAYGEDDTARDSRPALSEFCRFMEEVSHLCRALLHTIFLL
jgi:hypothetical protein